MSRAVEAIARHNKQLRTIKITNIFFAAAADAKYRHGAMPDATEPYEMILSRENEQLVSPGPLATVTVRTPPAQDLQPSEADCYLHLELAFETMLA